MFRGRHPNFPYFLGCAILVFIDKPARAQGPGPRPRPRVLSGPMGSFGVGGPIDPSGPGTHWRPIGPFGSGAHLALGPLGPYSRCDDYYNCGGRVALNGSWGPCLLARRSAQQVSKMSWGKHLASDRYVRGLCDGLGIVLMRWIGD